jgi:hypothetical protein
MLRPPKDADSTYKDEGKVFAVRLYTVRHALHTYTN